MSQTATAGTSRCPTCNVPVPPGQRFCAACGTSLSTAARPAPPPLPPERLPALPPSPPAVGRSHRPWMALLTGLALPGGGQAYNGRVFRAFLVALIAGVLVYFTMRHGALAIIPGGIAAAWHLAMAALAWVSARAIVGRGGRYGKGGLLWVFLQFWLVANFAVLVLIGLTLKGVLQ